MTNTEALRQIVEMVFADKTSDELGNYAYILSDNTEEAAEQFCDFYDLGNWFYEALILNDIDIASMIYEIADELRILENEAADERAEMERDYQRMQGWPA